MVPQAKCPRCRVRSTPTGVGRARVDHDRTTSQTFSCGPARNARFTYCSNGRLGRDSTFEICCGNLPKCALPTKPGAVNEKGKVQFQRTAVGPVPVAT